MADGVAVIIAALGAVITVALVLALVLRRRMGDDAGLLLVQQQLDALRGQMSQSMEATSRLTSDRTDALQVQIQTRLEEVTRAMGERLADQAQVLHRVSESLGQRLDANLQIVGQRFTETSGMVTTVHERLKGLEEAASRIFELGRDLASLQEILRPPKLRGGMGEVLLENLLANGLAGRVGKDDGHFEMQYRFTNGTAVDAVIHLGGRLVPVDSKFPLEAVYAVLRAESDDDRSRCRRDFVRQVQGHIKTIADKYIVPAEGTYDFALMYIPAESVYYEAVVRDDDGGGVYAYAMDRKVIPVSPTTFYAYLVALAYGLKGLQVEKQAAQIRAGLAQLTLSFERLREPFDKLGEQLRRAQKNHDDADRALERFKERLESLSGATVPEISQPQALPLESPRPALDETLRG